MGISWNKIDDEPWEAKEDSRTTRWNVDSTRAFLFGRLHAPDSRPIGRHVAVRETYTPPTYSAGQWKKKSLEHRRDNHSTSDAIHPPTMPKSLHKVHKHIAKKRGAVEALHENSRDAKRLRKANARDDRVARVTASLSRGRQSYSEYLLSHESSESILIRSCSRPYGVFPRSGP